MVGDSRTAHIHQRGNIYHTFFTVAQKPEDTDTVSVSKLLKYFRRRLKIFRRGYLLRKAFYLLAMIVGQRTFFHKIPLF